MSPNHKDEATVVAYRLRQMETSILDLRRAVESGLSRVVSSEVFEAKNAALESRLSELEKLTVYVRNSLIGSVVAGVVAFMIGKW